MTSKLSVAVLDLAQTLTQRLADLHARLRQLAELAGEKLAALRRADAPALTECAAREEILLREQLSDDAQHKALLARLAQTLHCPAAPRVTLAEIADRLPEPAASHLRARTAALRQIAAVLQQKNQLAADVARKLQFHLRGVFTDLAAPPDVALYGPQGHRLIAGAPQPVGEGSRRFIDAVG